MYYYKNITIIFIFLHFFVGYVLKAQQPSVAPFRFSYATKPEDVGFSTKKLGYLDSLLSEYVKTNVMPNAVTFIYRNGKVLHHKVYGYKNIAKKQLLKKDDIFRIASQTKALTSVGLMLLYERGKFLLDDPVSLYIPEFKNPKVLISSSNDSIYQTKPAKSEITIRQLLSHTSGISYGNAIYKKAKIPSINSLGQETIGQVVKRLATLPLNHNPGEKYTYGLNTDVVGYLIEVLSGMPLDKYFEQNLFEPLGMNDSYFYLPKSKAERLVTLYSKDSMNTRLYVSKDSANQFYPIAGAQKYFSGGAGVVGPIEDYAKFCVMLLNGGKFNGKQIIGRKTIDLMTINQIGDLEVWDSEDKFGLGFQIFTPKGLAHAPGSVGAFKWGGAYSTDYIIDPTENLVMLIYTNVLPFANPDINKRFRIMVYQALRAK